MSESIRRVEQSCLKTFEYERKLWFLQENRTSSRAILFHCVDQDIRNVENKMISYEKDLESQIISEISSGKDRMKNRQLFNNWRCICPAKSNKFNFKVIILILAIALRELILMNLQ